MVQVHQGRAAARCQETVAWDERLSVEALDSLYSGIIVLTPEGIVLEINEILLAQAQIWREEVVGRPLAKARWWSFYPSSQEQLRASIARASRGETVHFETVVHPREGIDHYLEVVITPPQEYGLPDRVSCPRWHQHHRAQASRSGNPCPDRYHTPVGLDQTATRTITINACVTISG